MRSSITCNLLFWVTGTQLSQGGMQDTSWTSHLSLSGPTQTDRQPFTLTFTPTGNSESPIKQTCMSLDCGRKPTQALGEKICSWQMQ
ncbi:hypothetical protein Q5P01_026159 [Channa striata]|uniref:Uncharacterized protein n=1 Tax=Channa striata TaxID=64152 RepID=A0AA88IKH2_CHASR|nr:hypothetical protein Q5P01_026159 [Channa striata]